MSRQEGWMRRAELVILVAVAVLLANGYLMSK